MHFVIEPKTIDRKMTTAWRLHAARITILALTLGEEPCGLTGSRRGRTPDLRVRPRGCNSQRTTKVGRRGLRNRGDPVKRWHRDAGRPGRREVGRERVDVL